MQHRLLWTVALAAPVLLIASVGCPAADWDSFEPASLTGIGLDKPLETDVLDYTLLVAANPTITIGGQTYVVNWVQAFYAVSMFADRPITATNGSASNGWSWDSKGGNIAGWAGKGSNRLKPGESATFSFATFDTRESVAIPGFHLAYQAGSSQMTGWYKASPDDEFGLIPEASTALVVGAALGLLVSVRVRRGGRTGPATHR